MRIFVLLTLLLTVIRPASANDQLTVLLDWFVNPDHAALIIAEQRGMFSEAGLDVELIAPADPSAPPRLVASDQGDIAITYQPQLHVQVAEGLPLVRIGTLAETPLNALVVLDEGPIKTIADLKGKTVGYSVGGFEDALLAEMLRQNGLTLADIELVNINFALSPSLISGRVDAVIGAFRNFELNQLDIEGYPGRAFFPEEHGVPVYDELILVTKRGRDNDPTIRNFLDVIEAATLWLTNHPDQAWRIFADSAPELDNELNRRAWYDTLPRLAKRPAALDSARYLRFAEFMKKAGLIDNIIPLEEYAVEPGRPGS
jgi:putative hydroxymethylpyrimidine transport system substrate-binding protein